MSEITDRIREYVPGRPAGWETLRDWLATRRYPDPARYHSADRDPLRADSSDFPYTEGTWDEVTEAANFGLLTEAEYAEIVAAADAATRSTPG